MTVEQCHHLREYRGSGSDDAFQALVQNHAGLVYSTALRLVAGDHALAADVTQNVFCELARKAPSLPENVFLPGWLHRAACHRAKDAVRAERRRKEREKAAVEMSLPPEADRDIWGELQPLLDDALESLPDEDRHALLARYFQSLSLRAVGAAFQISEDAAQKRVSRALERLRVLLLKRGLRCSTAALSSALAVNAVFPGPIHAAGIAAIAAAAGAVSATAPAFPTLALLMTKTQFALSAVLVAAIGGLGLQHREIGRLRAENSAMAERNVAMPESPGTNPPPAAALNSDDLLELMRLRAEVAELRRLKETAPADGKPARAGSVRQAAQATSRSLFLEGVQFQDKGTATPSDAAESFIFALTEENGGRLTEIWNIDAGGGDRAQALQMFAQQFKQMLQADEFQIGGLSQITPLGEDYARARFQGLDSGVTKEFIVDLARRDGKWQAGGLATKRPEDPDPEFSPKFRTPPPAASPVSPSN